MCASNMIFFEFLRNIFFRHELLKDEEILENGGSGLNILVLKKHVFGSTDLSFDFRALRPVAIERACDCGHDMVFFKFLHFIFFRKHQKVYDFSCISIGSL